MLNLPVLSLRRERDSLGFCPERRETLVPIDVAQWTALVRALQARPIWNRFSERVQSVAPSCI